MRYLAVDGPSADPARHTTNTRFDAGTSPQALFVFRLRLHRERRRLTLDQLARITRVRRELFEGLEQNDLAEWPRGLYARAWVRQYATLVGLDPEETVEEFCRLFPNGDRRASTLLRAMAALLVQPSEYQETKRDVERRRSLNPRARTDSARPAPAFRKRPVPAFR